MLRFQGDQQSRTRVNTIRCTVLPSWFFFCCFLFPKGKCSDSRETANQALRYMFSDVPCCLRGFLCFFLFPKGKCSASSEITNQALRYTFFDVSCCLRGFLCCFLFSKRKGFVFRKPASQAPRYTFSDVPHCLRGFSLLLSFFLKRKKNCFACFLFSQKESR